MGHGKSCLILNLIFLSRKKSPSHNKNWFLKGNALQIILKVCMNNGWSSLSSYQRTSWNRTARLSCGYCVTSTVHPEKGLFYCEHPLDSISGWEPERVIFLLLHDMKGVLRRLELLKSIFRNGHIFLGMSSVTSDSCLKKASYGPLCRSASDCRGIWRKGDYQEDCLNLNAKNSWDHSHFD